MFVELKKICKAAFVRNDVINLKNRFISAVSTFFKLALIF